MINCEFLSHVYLATPPIPRSCACLDATGKFGFRASKVYLGLARIQASSSSQSPFTTLRYEQAPRTRRSFTGPAQSAGIFGFD